MAEVISMLALSPTMDEGTLVEWLKSEGDTVEEGEIIAEIETDKATMEMESFHDGTVLKLIASKGDALPVGAPLAVVGDDGEDISDLLADLESGDGDSTEDGAESQESAEVEKEATETDEARRAEPATTTDDGGRLKASPLARRMAEEEAIDLSRVGGSGPNGRIIKRDIEAAIESGQARPGAAARPLAEPAAAESTERPLSQMRKTIARRLVEVWETTPHFYLTMTIDMAQAMKTRKEINQQLAESEAGVKISVNDMIVKASGMALARYPKMNVSFQGDHVVEYGDVHVGVAVAIEDGLITPVVRNVDRKTLSQISSEIRELARRAKDKRLTPEEYTGSTFSVSNLGMYGIDHFSAIINPPEAAILACGAVKKEPVVGEDDQLTVGTTMKVTLSVDHRAADGAIGSEYLQELKRLLENPILLMI